LPVELGPWGTFPCNVFWNQKSNALYAAYNLIWRYDFHPDPSWAEKAHEFLLAVADFWEDSLVWEDGRYSTVDDAFHEEITTTDRNSLITLTLLREFFRGILTITETLGTDADRHVRWRHILDHLSPLSQQVRDGQTILSHVESGASWNHSLWLLYHPVWPCRQIGMDSAPEALELARRTFQAVDKWDDPNGFCSIYATGARLGFDPTVLLEQLRQQCRKHGRDNLWIFNEGGGLENCTGVTAGLQEMLLQSHQGVVRVFPNWPADRPARFSTLRAEGGLLVSAEFDGGVRQITLLAEVSGTWTVANPWTKRRDTVDIAAGQVLTLKAPQ
jgi:hypothetical protein